MVGLAVVITVVWVTAAVVVGVAFGVRVVATVVVGVTLVVRVVATVVVGVAFGVSVVATVVVGVTLAVSVGVTVDVGVTLSALTGTMMRSSAKTTATGMTDDPRSRDIDKLPYAGLPMVSCNHLHGCDG
jgi:hypothetical protein